MTKHIVKHRSHVTGLMIWGLIYLTLAFISLELDNPQTRVAMVWFPAGATVSACLSLPRKWWPGLYLTLFVLRSGIDMTMRHSMETSLVISFISISGDFSIAAVLQRFGRNRDDLGRVCIWLLSTFFISIMCATAGAAWLSSRHDISFISTFSLWWAANISGNIIATTILTGLMSEPLRHNPQEVIRTFTSVMVIAITSLLIFSMPSGEEAHAGLIFGLACLPVMILVVVPLVAGTQAGALAFMTLSIIAIFLSWHHSGPFFIKGLRIDEPLLLAQCYLCGAALLSIFMRLIIKLPESRLSKVNPEGISFRINIISGRIEWDPHGDRLLFRAVTELDNRAGIKQWVDSETHEIMQNRWQKVASGCPENPPFKFHLCPPSVNPLTIRENCLFFLEDESGGYIVGNWIMLTGSELFPKGNSD